MRYTIEFRTSHDANHVYEKCGGTGAKARVATSVAKPGVGGDTERASI